MCMFRRKKPSQLLLISISCSLVLFISGVYILESLHVHNVNKILGKWYLVNGRHDDNQSLTSKSHGREIIDDRVIMKGLPSSTINNLTRKPEDINTSLERN